MFIIDSLENLVTFYSETIITFDLKIKIKLNL